MAKRYIVVAGDVVVDHHLYAGERITPTNRYGRGVRPVRQWGGAAGIAELLAHVLREAEQQDRARKTADEGDKFQEADALGWQAGLGTTRPDRDAATSGHHAFAAWKPVRKNRIGDDKTQVWRADQLMGYGHPDAAPGELRTDYRPQPIFGFPSPAILVLDDAGFVFRDEANQAAWMLPEAGSPTDWILLKLSDPIARGRLWEALESNHADRLVCLVSAHDLREEFVEVSHGLSWERTVDDLRRELSNSPVLRPLLQCRHLIIPFAADGALWLERLPDQRHGATLIFDAEGAEGAYDNVADGRAFGYLTGMTAAIAHALARQVTRAGGPTAAGLPDAIERGLAGMRNLKELGHGVVAEGTRAADLPNGYPFARIAKTILKPTGVFSRAVIPWPSPGRGGGEWTIVMNSQRPMGFVGRSSVLGLARQVVIQGHAALRRVPHAKIGDLTTADRNEIETLRNILRLMRRFRDDQSTRKPLSIGVFGPPGAGKSFGVKELAKQVFPGAWLEFNLSQFTPPADMVGALHQVRDRVLDGTIPVVFWDEFDSREYEWLQYLLAPMQDGRFQHGQLNHAVGKCVFIFAGGTSPNFASFGPPASRIPSLDPNDPRRRFELRKGPDFKSRLDAYYDVLGPNPRLMRIRNKNATDPTDLGYPLRRAILIRHQLRVGADEHVDIDPDLLDALLLTDEYQNGARSLEKLVEALRPQNGTSVRRSTLIPPFHRQMHVNAASIDTWLNRNTQLLNEAAIEQLARTTHENWRAMPERRRSDRFDRSWAQLAEVDKEDNREAASRLTEILGLVGLAVERPSPWTSTTGASTSEVAAHLEHDIERLAEAEHDGWMRYRKRTGWRFGKPTDNDAQVHERLVAYADLPEHEKDKDRDTVRSYPRWIADAGYRIVWI